MILPASFSLFIRALGWAVVHSLWQIAIIWLVFKTLSWIFRGRNQLLYRLALLSMLVSAYWFLDTLAGEQARMAEAALAPVSVENLSVATLLPINTEQAGISEITAAGMFEMAGVWLENHALQVGWAWSICVVLLWLRLAGGWWMVQRLRRRNVVVPDAVFSEQCGVLAKKLKINALVRLLESPHVHEPLTIGFWKPVILFPLGMLTSLTPAQAEALLLHELAHIRRYDYLVNLFQLALETCFFYHPLFWLISRDTRVRREFCCDDVVLYHTIDPILYAKTLTDLQLSALHPTTQFTMNATGKSRFTERILRIAGISPRRESRPNWLIVMLLPAFIALCSWWPSQAASLPANTGTSGPIPEVADTLPPGKPARNVPNTVRAETGRQGDVQNNKTTSTQPAPDTAAPKVAMEAVKMNVFYIGVDNPLRVAVSDVPARELKVEIKGNGSITGSDGNYLVRVLQPGEATVRVSRNSNGKEIFISEQTYRVKRIPDPSPMLAGIYNRGIITKEKLQTGKSLETILLNFDFDAVCEVVGYEITILPKEQDPLTWNAIGGAIPSGAREMIETLGGDGDAIFFDDIKVKCPGDVAVRNIGGLAFKLKPAQ